MNQLNHTTIVNAIITRLKTVADSAFPIVGPGEPDPDAGETATADALTCFARLDSVRWVPMPRRNTNDVHHATLDVTVMFFVTGANADPLADAASQLQSIVNVLDMVNLQTSTGTGTQHIDLQSAGCEEQTPPPEAIANRMVVIKASGMVKVQ